MNIGLKTVERIVKREKEDLNRWERSRKNLSRRNWRNHVCRFTMDAIRRIVHSFFKKGLAPTAQQVHDQVGA